MTRRWFVAGTDTGIGKTCVAAGLLRLLERAGQRTAAMKPVATGCLPSGEGLRNADAMALIAAMSEYATYTQVNPVALVPPVAPHLAAAEVGLTLDPAALAAAANELPAADHVVIEGAGGWRVPLGDDTTFADLARALDASVVLVVGMRLGCINHALLTAEAIERDGIPFAGWVANGVDPEAQRVDDQIASIRCRLRSPLLGVVPYMGRPEPDRVADCLTLPGGCDRG